MFFSNQCAVKSDKRVATDNTKEEMERHSLPKNIVSFYSIQSKIIQEVRFKQDSITENPLGHNSLLLSSLMYANQPGSILKVLLL